MSERTRNTSSELVARYAKIGIRAVEAAARYVPCKGHPKTGRNYIGQPEADAVSRLNSFVPGRQSTDRLGRDGSVEATSGRGASTSWPGRS
jgi:hypothetical protein